MLAPMLIDIQLQERGEVLTGRRVRFATEAEANRVYNLLEALLLAELGNTPNACAECGVPGPEHGHYDVTNPDTHKFVSRLRP